MNIQVSTFAGGDEGCEDGKVEMAKFNGPSGICMSEDGRIYLIDFENNCIRMISDGIVSTVAGDELGHQDGKAEEALFYEPRGICIDDDGTIYISDSKNHSIRMISDGIVSTIAGTGDRGFKDGEYAMFSFPIGICISKFSDLYIVDGLANRIRKLTNGVVSTIAGNGDYGYQDGKAGDAMFASPNGICIADDGKIYVVDCHNHRIRMIWDGLVSTFAGCGKDGLVDGKAEDARFFYPGGISMSDDGRIFIADQRNHCIRMISDGMVSTIAGNGEEGFRDGKGEDAMFNWPDALCVSSDGNIYVTDAFNHRIRMISGIPKSPSAYFELSLLLNSKSLSDMTLTINNHQYHLHTAVVHSLCPMVIKHISTIEDAKISNESLQTMFEMIYSNNTIKIRKQKPNEYQMTDLTHLVELVWLFESFEINNQSFVPNCIKQLKIRLKHLMKQDEHNPSLETLKNDLIHRTNVLIALSQLQTTKLIQINHFINQNKQNENEAMKRNTNIDKNIISISMHDMFLLLGLHTEPRVVDQQQIKSETVLKYLETPNTELKTQPDYTIMTHDRSYSIKCHKVILYAKWSYFRRMIESGLLESASGEMIMSEDWNATRLFDFIKYLYTHEVGFDTKEDCRWLLNNAELYELIQKSDVPEGDFELLIQTCEKILIE